MPVKKSVGWPEIDEVVAECQDSIETESTRFPARTYEDGVKAGIEWVTGLASEHPLEKEE